MSVQGQMRTVIPEGVNSATTLSAKVSSLDVVYIVT